MERVSFNLQDEAKHPDHRSRTLEMLQAIEADGCDVVVLAWTGGALLSGAKRSEVGEGCVEEWHKIRLDGAFDEDAISAVVEALGQFA